MIYKFNNIELDTEKFRLLTNGKETAVEPQVFNIIVYLIKNKDKIVSRDDLLDYIWKHKVVSDTSINNHIKSARKVLNDDGIKQQVIKTIHSRGYQFVAKTQNFSAKELKPKSYLPLFYLTIIAVLGIGLLLFIYKQQSQVDDTIIEYKNIAVLPFANIKPDSDTDYLGFALASQIIGELSYVKGFEILPAGSIRKYVDERADPIKAAQQLKVDFVLSGNYLKENDVIRLTVELIQTNNLKVLWKEAFAVNYSNTFTLQDLVSSKVIKGLNASFSQSFIDQYQKDIPANALAYEYYLRGLSYPFDNKSHQLAIEMLNKSIQIDPNYAPAYASLGIFIRLLKQHGYVTLNNLNDAQWYYQKALQLNPNLLLALRYSSYLYTESNELEKAYELAKRMQQINPNSIDTHRALAYIYRYAGMNELAIREIETALKSSPNNPRLSMAIPIYKGAGYPEKALSYLSIAARPYANINGGTIEYNLGNMKKARNYFQAIIDDNEGGIWEAHASFYLALMEGDIDTARQFANILVANDAIDGENYFHNATAFALIKDKKASLDMLEKAVDTGFFNYKYISQTPEFSVFYDEPRFKDILLKAKKRHEAFKAKFF